MAHDLYISLGSNLGNKEENLRRAIALIDERLGSVYRVSSFIETEPVGFDSDNNFLNAVCCVHTMCAPERCLVETQRIERELGREKKSKNGQYEDRVIDIDLLTYDDLHLEVDVEIKDEIHHLSLPHPRMTEREFVMIPLKEIEQN